MTRHHFLAFGGLASVCLGLTLLGSGCEGRITIAQLREALIESSLQGEVQAMTNDMVEITTSFTIGQALDEIRDEVVAFAESQVPCSTVTANGDDGLTIDFGELGDCEYRGRTYAGTITIELELSGDAVIVHHDYASLRNEHIDLDGSVDVTWGGGARKVVSNLEFSGTGSDDETRTLTIEAERTMTFVDEAQGLAGGVEIDGYREWTGARGDWHLDIESVEVRGSDPVPQAGSYTLTTPEQHEITMTFARVDEDTIAVTVVGPRRERVFEVTSDGDVGE